MNALIVYQFNKLIKLIKAQYLDAQLNGDTKKMEIDTYRLKQTKRALSIILALDFEIKSENDIKGIAGIGKGTIARVKEILETGKLSELDHFNLDESKINSASKIKSIQQLLKIIGVGDRLARKLVIDNNITTVAELRSAVNLGKIKVSRQVNLGLKYYDLIERKIPRKEISQIETYLTKKALEIDPDLHIKICGSYRRGVLISGDIDVMIYHPKIKFVRQIFLLEKHNFDSYLELFVDLLIKEKFIVDTLAASQMKYMGFCVSWNIFSKYRYTQSFSKTNNNLNNIKPINIQSNEKYIRRIDIRFMPYNSIPAAMLYFTGPQQLNEEMRLRAKKQNMLLNEYGLFILDSQGNRYNVPVSSEKDIFLELGMVYLTPQERQKYAFKR